MKFQHITTLAICLTIAIPALGSSKGVLGTELANGESVSNLRGDRGDISIFYITVPAGRSILKITTTGGVGDLDMFVKHGSTPKNQSYDHKSTSNTTTESVIIKNPAQGRHFVLLSGFKQYKGVTIQAVYDRPRPQHHPRRVSADRWESNDRWESDDRCSKASRYRILPQTHTIHHEDDVDWISYTPMVHGSIQLAITKADVRVKLEVFKASDINTPIAQFATSSFRNDGNYSAFITIPTHDTKSILVKVSASRRRQGTYRIFFNNIKKHKYSTWGSNHNTKKPLIVIKRPSHKPVVIHKPLNFKAKTLQLGEKENNIKADDDESLYFKVYVPQRTKLLTIVTSAGKGNPDIYASYNSVPTTNSKIHSATRGIKDNSTFESISIHQPRSGWLYLLVYAKSEFKKVDLRVTAK